MGIYPDLKVQVVPTGGSVESMQLIAEDNADLATVQADTPACDESRMGAILYPDLSQLLVLLESTANPFPTSWISRR